MDVGRPGKIIWWVVVALRGILHNIMPDGASSRNTNDVVHDTVVAIASPDSDGQVGCIAQRPVIAETIGGACFGGSRTIQFQRVAWPEFVVARALIGENAIHQIGHISADHSFTVWMARIELVDGLVLIIADLKDRSWRHTYTLIGEGSVGPGHM